MRGSPESWSKLPPIPDVMGMILHDMDATVHRARRGGVDRLRIVVDPGLGFGKRKEQNSEILARLSQLAILEYPILVGPSRKSFLAQPTEKGTAFATASAWPCRFCKGPTWCAFTMWPRCASWRGSPTPSLKLSWRRLAAGAEVGAALGD